MCYRFVILINVAQQSFIKNKTLSLPNSIRKLLAKINNSSFELIHIFKTSFFHVSRSLFTSNASSTIHNNFLFLINTLLKIIDKLRKFSERFYSWVDSILKSP